MSDVIDLAMAAAAESADDPRSVEETLATIVETARVSLPGFEHIGVSTVDGQGYPTTRGATSQLVLELDALQYGLWEGPCVDTLRSASVVEAPNIQRDPRWPRFVAAATPLGLRSQLAVRLYLDGEGTVGGLNIYSTTSDDVDPEAVSVAILLATYGAVALGKAETTEDLLERLGAQAVISQAIQLLMAKYGVGEDRAFGILVRGSSHSQRTVRAVAAAIVRKSNE
jgi:GAF domain-containing protein